MSKQIHPKFREAVSCEIARKIAKDPRSTSQTLHPSFGMLHVKVNDNAIRKRLKTYGLFARVARSLAMRNPVLFKKCTTAWLSFAKYI